MSLYHSLRPRSYNVVVLLHVYDFGQSHTRRVWTFRDDALLNSVVRAGTSKPEILDQLLRSGADAHAWMQPEVEGRLSDEEDLSPSALALSTPLHAAIASDNLDMLSVLLD